MWKSRWKVCLIILDLNGSAARCAFIRSFFGNNGFNQMLYTANMVFAEISSSSGSPHKHKPNEHFHIFNECIIITHNAQAIATKAHTPNILKGVISRSIIITRIFSVFSSSSSLAAEQLGNSWLKCKWETEYTHRRSYGLSNHVNLY